MQYMDRTGGLAGWQWVFLLEGLPAIVMGFVTIRYLTDRPEQADWLTPAERNWLRSGRSWGRTTNIRCARPW